MKFKTGDVVWVEELYGATGDSYGRRTIATIVKIDDDTVWFKYPESYPITKIEPVYIRRANFRKLTKLEKALR